MIDIWSYFGGRGAPPLPKGEPGAARGMRKAKAGFNSFPGAQPGEGAFAPPFVAEPPVVVAKAPPEYAVGPGSYHVPPPNFSGYQPGTAPDFGALPFPAGPSPRAADGREGRMDEVAAAPAPAPSKKAAAKPRGRDAEFQARLEASGFGPGYEYMMSPFAKDPKG